MNRCAVSVAVGGYHGTKGTHYADAQRRLASSLRDAGDYGGTLNFWSDEYPPGSERHPDLPYHFKPTAMLEAAKYHRTLLWLDAVMMAVRPVDEVFELIEKHGYLLWSHPAGNWTIGERTSDACLEYYEVPRGVADIATMCCSAVFGYSLDHPLGRKLHEAFVSTPSLALRGAWHNRNNAVSKNHRVKGHRHDQSVLSILAYKLGLEMTPTPYPVSFLGSNTERTVFVHDPHGKVV